MAKSIRVIDAEAIRLINERAKRERRSAASACAVTIIEHLGPKYLHGERIHGANFSGKIKTREEFHRDL